MRKIYLIVVGLFLVTSVAGQCNLLPNALPGLTLTYQSTNLLNCSGVAYNPIRQLYYAVRAGNSSFPLETWDNVGTPLYTNSAGFDWRGMWWNPNTSQLEGNGYLALGMWRANLNASGYALNTGVNIFTGQAQPDAQSCGDYDYLANEVLYYFSGRIYRYSRATNAALGNFLLTGVPVALGNLNSTTVVYTGCVGKEIGVLDYILKRIYLFSKTTGAYFGMSQLPASAVTTTSFRFSWANGLAWLFDLGTRTWYSYQIFDNILAQADLRLSGKWASQNSARLEWEMSDFVSVGGFEVERSVDGIDFQSIALRNPADFEADRGQLRLWVFEDALVQETGMVWYRIMARDFSGESWYSNIVSLSRQGESESAISLWPNPSSEEINIFFDLSNGIGSIRVYDATGKTVLARELVEGERKSGSMQIGVAELAEGIYFLQLISENGRSKQLRFVVSR